MSNSHIVTARQITMLMLFYTGDTDTLSGMQDEYVVSVFDELHAMQMVHCTDPGRSNIEAFAKRIIRKVEITPRGKVYIEHLLTRPLPVQSWAIPTV